MAYKIGSAVFRALLSVSTISFFLLPGNLPAQPLSEVSSYGVNIGTVAVDGNNGVINEGTFLRVVTLSAFNPPVYRGAVDIGAVPGCLRLVGNYAYSAEETGWFTIVDISNPDAPSIASRVGWVDWKEAVWVRRKQDYAYVASCSGIRVIDIRNKTNPTIVGTLPSNGCVYSLDGDGGYLYVGHGSGQDLLSIYSLATPGNPVLVGSGPPDGADGFHHHNALAVFGDTAYSDQTGELAVIDISDRSVPRTKKLIPINSGQVPLDVSNGILHAVVWDTSSFYTLATPDSPSLWKSLVSGSGNEVMQVAAQDGISYSARSDSLWVTDVASEAISRSRTITPDFGVADQLAVAGNVLFVTSGPWLFSFNISNPVQPMLLGKAQARWSRDLVTNGNYVYNISGWGWLEVFDVRNPSALKRLSTIYAMPGPDAKRRLSLQGDILIASAGNAVTIFRTRTDGLLNQLSQVTLPTDMNATAHSQNAMYVGTKDGNLLVYDISNPGNPVESNRLSLYSPTDSQYANEVACRLVGDRLYVLFGQRGLVACDVSSPLNPVFLGKLTLYEEGVSIASDTNYAYLAQYGPSTGGLRAISISQPSAMYVAAQRRATNYVSDVVLDGEYVFYAEGRGCLRVRRALAPQSGVPDYSIY